MSSPGSRSRPSDAIPEFRSLAGRISILAVLFAAEMLGATLWLDGASPAPPDSRLALSIHVWGPWMARFAVAFSTLFVTFAWLKYQPQLEPFFHKIEPVRWRLLLGHFAAIGLFAIVSRSVYGNHLPGMNANLAAGLWILAGSAAIVLGALALFTRTFWTNLFRATGLLWIYAAAAAVLTSLASGAFRSLWAPASRTTFQMVRFFLSPFVSDLVIQPEHMRIGTHRFMVVIADECSGLEGIGLLLIFTLIWLALFRNEARFPQALVLLPLGIAALFVLNALRITALILIGNAGAPDIAAGGFHSQAGWIAFNSVAFGSSILARRWSWISVRAPSPIEPEIAEQPDSTAALLMPFLAILAAGMISRAASGAFDWLYPIRFLAVLAMLWIFRRSYKQLDWHCGPLAAIAGVAVFLVWIAAERFSHGSLPMPAALASAPGWIRNTWILLRILGGVLTVPVAEELAFRGYLLRRLSGADFESIPFHSTTWLAVAGSSILFGWMHGARWLLGAMAGLVYSVLIRRTGRIGDAVAAHAFTNLLLAGFVLLAGQWQLWG